MEASGASAARYQKDHSREARRTSIVQLFISNRLHWQEQPRPVGRPGTERPLWRPVRQPCAGTEIRTVRERSPPRNHYRTVARNRARLERQAPPARQRHTARCMTSRTAATEESKMIQPHSVASREQVVDAMIDFTRLAHPHRAIIAGSDSLELYLALRRRGFVRVATTATCRIPRGQHSVGLITGQNSLVAIETALTEISRFLCANASIAVLID